MIKASRDDRDATDDKMVDVSLRASKEQSGLGWWHESEPLFAVRYGVCFQSDLGVLVEKTRISAGLSGLW